MPEEMIDGQTASAEESVVGENESLDNLETSQEPSEPEDLSGQQAIEQNPVKEATDWTKDARHTKMWKGEVNGLYDSYRNLEGIHESKYKPMEQEYNTLLSKFKDNGLDVNNFDQDISRYRELTDPNNATVQENQILQALYHHPVYGGWVEDLMKRAGTQEREREYPNWTNEQIEKQQGIEQKLNELESKNEKYETQERIQKEVGMAEKELEEINKLTQEIGLSFNEEEKWKFINQQIQNGIHVSNWENIYRRENRERIKEATKAFYTNQTLKTLNKNKQSVPSQAGINTAKGTKTLTNNEIILEAIKKQDMTI